MVKLFEGDIGGYPIPQYRKKNSQIPKYRVENRRNLEYCIYDWSRLLNVVSISCVFYLKHVYTRNQPQPSRENGKSRIDRYNDRKARLLNFIIE